MDNHVICNISGPEAVESHLEPARSLEAVEHDHSLATVSSGPSPGVIAGQQSLVVPHRRYTPYTSEDRHRYVEDAQLDPPITFSALGPTEEGIPLEDAIHNPFCLNGRDDLMFVGRGPSISIRLNWPGYPSWSRQIPTRDFRSPPGPITRAKLAKNIAQVVIRFIEEHQAYQTDDNSKPSWRVGPHAIQHNDLILLRLEHVTKSSWQPHFRLVKPR